MSDKVSKIIADESSSLIKSGWSRRSFLAGAGVAAAATVVGCGDSGTKMPTTPPPSNGITDVDILTFALNLEYLEAEYYLRAATGSGLSATDAGANPGTVTGGTMVPFTGGVLQQYAIEIAQNELNHVRALRAAITSAGATPVSRPNLDFTNGFNGAASAAGIGSSFNPFGDVNSFLVGAFTFEDVGVTAYSGAAPLISSKAILTAAAGIQAVEAYHAGEIRTIIAGSASAPGADQTYLTAANAISALRAKLGGGAETTLSISSIVAADPNTAVGFARMTDAVLHIVYAAGAGVQTKGGFFPSGLNGKITATAS